MSEPNIVLPYLTAATPGIGGVMRAHMEDFRVEERPLYLPCGQGEHTYLRVTKRGLSTPDLVKQFASALGVKARCIGVAGLKDARAVTTQMVSVQVVKDEAIARLATNDRVLSIEVLGRHRNRLRTGHHAGNRFTLTIRDVHDAAADTIPQVLDVLLRRGVPNYFGPQRQGKTGLNYETGALLLRDESRRARIGRTQRVWFLNAYQSHIYNKILAARINRLDQTLVGDWAMKHANGACFQVEHAEVEQTRADAFEISPTGLLFGSRASWASGEPGDIERAVVAELSETPESLKQAAADCGFRGERRSLRVRLDELEWSLKDRTLTISYALPPGSYATSVLRELMKTDELQLGTR
jgi:tRNA pseudouridine13 synthase